MIQNTKTWKRLQKMIGYHGIRSYELYILRNCENTKFYVGITKDFEKRYSFAETNKFKLYYNINQLWLRIPVPANLTKEEAEGLLYEEMANLYGKDNVRGAYITRFEYPKSRYEIIQLKRKHYTNSCYKCGEKNHIARNCPNYNILDLSEYC